MKYLKKLKSYIGLLLTFSFMLQVTAPLVAAVNNSHPKLLYPIPRSVRTLIIDYTINDYITTIVDDAKQVGMYRELPKPIKRCYNQLCKNKAGIATQDIIEALPSILCYAVEQINQSPNEKETQSILALVNFAKSKVDAASDETCRTALEATLKEVCERLEACNVLCSTESDQIASRAQALDECCELLEADIANAQNTILHAIDSLCAPTSLTQVNVVDGTLQLTQQGSYILCSDITATLVIAANGISVDMNNHTLFGLVFIAAQDVTIKNGYIQAPGITTIDDTAAAVAVTNCALNTNLLNLTIICADSTGVDANNNGFNGRDGIYNNAQFTTIIDCFIQAGAGSPGGNTDPSPALSAGNGGNGGNGIVSLENNISIIRTTVTTGNGGDGGSTCIGGAGSNAGDGGSSGIGIQILALSPCMICDTNSICNSIICTGNGGNGGYSCCNDAGNGGNSGDGIINNCMNTIITESTIRTGNGGMGGISDTDTSGSGGNSGNAITTHGTQIINVILSTGDAGNGPQGANGGNGGNAGHGVFVDGACECQVRGVVVESTGNGGQGGNTTQTLMSGNGGSGGNGGDAIHITQNSKHTQVRSSNFSRTGRGGIGGTSIGTGTPGTQGAAGRAVTDLNNDPFSLDPLCTTTYYGPSIIFENFAYAIADTSIRYLINGP